MNNKRKIVAHVTLRVPIRFVLSQRSQRVVAFDGAPGEFDEWTVIRIYPHPADLPNNESGIAWDGVVDVDEDNVLGVVWESASPEGKR